jgi:hypothetical protein
MEDILREFAEILAKIRSVVDDGQSINQDWLGKQLELLKYLIDSLDQPGREVLTGKLHSQGLVGSLFHLMSPGLDTADVNIERSTWVLVSILSVDSAIIDQIFHPCYLHYLMGLFETQNIYIFDNV